MAYYDDDFPVVMTDEELHSNSAMSYATDVVSSVAFGVQWVVHPSERMAYLGMLMRRIHHELVMAYEAGREAGLGGRKRGN